VIREEEKEMNTQFKQYGNSVGFRMLKWLNPLLMTAVMALCWQTIYVPLYMSRLPAVDFAVMTAVYLLGLHCLQKIYHGQMVGFVRITELVYSQSLACVICNVLLYLAGSLHCNHFLAVWPMLVAFAGQFSVSICWSMAANWIYYANYAPPRTAIVYGSAEDLKRIESIQYFSEHFNVCKRILMPSGDPAALYAQLNDVQVVFAAGIDASLRSKITKFCVERNLKAYFIPKLSEIIMSGAEYMSMFSEPVMKVQRAQTRTEYMAVKRVMDVVAAALGLVVLSPVMLITALAIRLHDGGPVFYRQNRLTQNGRVFSILKFRSMKVNAEKDGVARLASAHDDRITPVGKLIRATRIDELPQLINILVGDMSLIGPRPERPEIAAEYEKTLPEFALRLQVKAGLSGMAQVYGRYNTDPYSKLQMDLMYINKLSLMTDLKLLFATVKVLFMKESTAGVQEGQRTAESKKSA